MEDYLLQEPQELLVKQKLGLTTVTTGLAGHRNRISFLKHDCVFISDSCGRHNGSLFSKYKVSINNSRTGLDNFVVDTFILFSSDGSGYLWCRISTVTNGHCSAMIIHPARFPAGTIGTGVLVNNTPTPIAPALPIGTPAQCSLPFKPNFWSG